MSGMICIKLYGDMNFDSEEEKILTFLDKLGFKFDFLSFGDD